MWWTGQGQVCGPKQKAGVYVAVMWWMLLCFSSVAGHCLNHITVTGGATVTGDADTLNVTLPLRETTEVGRLLYRLAWGKEEVAAPSIPTSEEFASYFYVDDSVAGELRVLLKRSLVGLPDYPMLKTNIFAEVVFPALSDGRKCSVQLTHLLQDDNTHAPSVKATTSFLQVYKNFPVSMPLRDVTVTVTDNDAAAPNNQLKFTVEGACPLTAVAAATTEERRYGGAAGQEHLVHLHLTSPLHDLTNETFACTLTVTDMGSPPLSSSVTFILQVVDGETPTSTSTSTSTSTTTTTTTTTTDTPPHLAHALYLVEVWPGMDAGTLLDMAPEALKVNRGDPALPKVTYTLRDTFPRGNWSLYFAIDSATGQVRLRRVFDATVNTAGGDSARGNRGRLVSLVIQAQYSSGRTSYADLQVNIRSEARQKHTTHDLQPSNASSRHPQPSNHSASSATCLCPASRRRDRARLSFSRPSYAAEVFSTDTFVGRVEATLVGRIEGLVRYSWAPGTNTTSFHVDSTSGVITMSSAGVSLGRHNLTIRATVGRFNATAQVTVRVLEHAAEQKTKGKQDDKEDVFMVLRSGSLRTCDPEELLGLQVAVGVLAGLLAVVLLAAAVAGVLLYRRRKARAQTEVKRISTLGSAYPNLCFTRDGPE